MLGSPIGLTFLAIHDRLTIGEALGEAVLLMSAFLVWNVRFAVRPCEHFLHLLCGNTKDFSSDGKKQIGGRFVAVVGKTVRPNDADDIFLRTHFAILLHLSDSI